MNRTMHREEEEVVAIHSPSTWMTFSVDLTKHPVHTNRDIISTRRDSRSTLEEAMVAETTPDFLILTIYSKTMMMRMMASFPLETVISAIMKWDSLLMMRRISLDTQVTIIMTEPITTITMPTTPTTETCTITFTKTCMAILVKCECNPLAFTVQVTVSACWSLSL